MMAKKISYKKKASVKLNEIVIYRERKLPVLLE